MDARCVGSVTALVPLLLLALSSSCDASDVQSFPQLPNSTYLTKTNHLEQGLGYLPSMTNAFLDVIQPKTFPWELLSIMPNDFQDEHTKQILEYEVGFLICAIIGLLFMVIMPLVGFCFCLCRCCNNCGGKMRQKADSNTPYRRCTFLSLLLFFTILVVTGAFFSIVANERLHRSFEESKDFGMNAIKDIKTYMTSIPKELDFIASQFTPVYNRTKESINFVDTKLGVQIQNIYRDQVEKIQSTSLNLSLLMSNSHDKLVKIDTLQQNLQSNLVKLNESLKNETRELNNMFATCPAPKCDVLKNDLDKLVPAADFNKAPNVDGPLNATNDVLKTDLVSLIKKGNDSFNSIPEMVKNQTESVSDASLTLDGIKVQVEGFSAHLNFFNSMNSTLSSYLNVIDDNEGDSWKMYKSYEFYRWIVALVICCIIFFIVLLIILGILFGLCGTSNKATPTSRGCVSHSGGNFLMAAVGFSFLLSWIIMIVVVVLFITGGNIHKLACKPISDRTFYEVSAQHHPFPFDSIHSRGTKHLDLLDTNLSLDTLQNIHDVSFFQFMIYKVGKFTIKSQSFSFLAVTLHLDVDRQISIVYGVASWYDLTPTANNFRFFHKYAEWMHPWWLQEKKIEMVSCYTNGQKTLSLPELGRGLSEIPICGSGRQNVSFSARNMLHSTVMKQRRWLDLVVICHG